MFLPKFDPGMFASRRERKDPDINHIGRQNESSGTVLIARSFCLCMFLCRVEKIGF